MVGEQRIKNYETYNNERKEQVFASNSKFKIKRLRYQVTDNKPQITIYRKQVTNSNHHIANIEFNSWKIFFDLIKTSESDKRPPNFKFSVTSLNTIPKWANC